MASVYQKPGRPGFYVWYVDEFGKEHDKAITAATRAEANRFKRDLERAIERRQFGLDPLPVVSDLTLGQLCEWWLKDVCPKAAEKRERSRLKTEVLDTKLGETLLHQVDAATLELHFKAMEKREPAQEPGTINRLRSSLGSVFTAAAALKKWLGPNPVPSTHARKVPKKPYTTLRPEEIALVLRVLSESWRDLFATAFYMALRKGELFALRKLDVNMREREITVWRSHDVDTTKGKRLDVLPIPAPLMPFLEAAMETSGPLLFPSPTGKQRKPTSKPEVVLRRAMARAGLVTGYRHTCRSCSAQGDPHAEEFKDPTPRRCEVERAGQVCGAKLWASPLPLPMKFHELRHSTATLLLRMGVPMYVVQKILRHANIKTTIDLYGHLDNADTRAAMDRMPDAEEAAAAAELRKAGNSPDRPRTTPRTTKEQAPDPLQELWGSGALAWSGTPDSNRRPSPWQGTARGVHIGAVGGKSAHLREVGAAPKSTQGDAGTPKDTDSPDRPRTAKDRR